MSTELVMSNLDLDGNWTKQWSKDICLVEPKGYDVIPVDDGIILYTVGDPYAGFLARHVDDLIYPFPKIAMLFNIRLDEAVKKHAQVIEFDLKLTDDDGWTFDGSACINIENGWQFMITNPVIGQPWVPTQVKVPPIAPNVLVPIRVDYVLDYGGRSITIPSVSVGGVSHSVTPLQKTPAAQLGWQKKSMVTQLQQGNSAIAGAQSWKINQFGYKFSK